MFTGPKVLQGVGTNAVHHHFEKKSVEEFIHKPMLIVTGMKIGPIGLMESQKLPSRTWHQD